MQRATGAVDEVTLTVALQEAEFPAASNERKTTVLAPRFAQVNALGVTVEEVTPQLSNDGLDITFSGNKVAEPVGPKFNVILLAQATVGGVTS